MIKDYFACFLAMWAVGLLANGQMIAVNQGPNYNAALGLTDANAARNFSVTYLGCTSPGNIVYEGEIPEFTFRIKNETNRPLAGEGKADLIPFGTKGIAGDVWTPSIFRAGEIVSTSLHFELPAGGTQDVRVKPTVPERKGGYGIILDLGENGRQFGTAFVRTFRAEPEETEYPKMMLDQQVGLEALDRLGVRTVRMEWGFQPDNPDYLKRLDDLMKEFSAHHITVLLVFEAGPGSKQPFGKLGRPWLGDDDVMLDAGSIGDCVWLPEQDDEFQKSVTHIATTYGWPKGPLTAVSLWNEPWEGVSISGWGSDSIRYRELFTRMAIGVEDARKQGASVMITGCDSSTNSWDKLFPEGKDDFLKWFDACTIHYQGIGSPSTYKLWRDRTGPLGRVKIWDTESWVANTDDRVAAVVATNRAAGYDCSMGVFHGDITSVGDPVAVKQADGSDESVTPTTAWPLAASVAAAQHFIGNRSFQEFLFQKGLPWIFVFKGVDGKIDDGTVVVAGDVGEILGENAFPFRLVRGLNEVKVKEEIRAQLAALPPDAATRADLQKQLDTPGTLSGGMLSLPELPYAHAYDFYGNQLPSVGGVMQVPLDFRGYYLRTDGSPGSFAKLLAALRFARVDGYEPLEVVARDAVKPFHQGGVFQLKLSNVLNRSIHGKLKVAMPGLQIDAPADESFAPFESKEITLKVSGESRPDNAYPLRLVFDAGVDGLVVHEEVLHVNAIGRRTVVVDGKLDDWNGALPQSIAIRGEGGPSLTEAAWQPFKRFSKDLASGVATAYLAYDDRYFYFAAKIADENPDEGTRRFEKLDEDSFFYPAISYEIDKSKKLQPNETSWMPASPAEALVTSPSADARNGKIWSASDGLGFIITADKPTQLAFYLVGSGSEKATVQLTDRASGKIVVRQEITTSSGYAVFNVRGNVHAIVRSAAVAGVFVDAVAPGNSATDKAAEFVRTDSGTQGNWPRAFGKQGYWLAGGEPHFSGGITVEGGPVVRHAWPDGVRRYTYRKDVELPAGNYPNYDNVQIAFNVLPQEAKITAPSTPGTVADFVPGQDTDYEFALNRVADQFGGGTEIWRLRTPQMYPKNFYPREPHAPHDGPVKAGKLAITQDGNTRLVEAAIPWEEIPEVKAAADAGGTVKFSFRVNTSKGIGMELAENRSVSKLNPHTFHSEWVQHWANKVEFGFEK